MTRRPQSEKKTIDLEKLREKFLKDSEVSAQKPKLGLFSSPVPLAVGDDSYYKPKKIDLDDNHLVKIPPRNIFSGHGKLGKVKSSYFSTPSYISIGCQFVEMSKVKALEESSKKAKLPVDTPVFRPSSGYKTIIKFPYPVQPNRDPQKEVKPKIIDGKVQTANPNILTGPVVKAVNKFPSHMKDEAERLDMQRKKDLEDHHKKMEGKPAFVTWFNKNCPINSDRKTLGCDVKLPEKKNLQTPKQKLELHERDFVPSNPPKKGYNRTISKFPKYIPDPEKEIKRKVETEKKEIFKPPTFGSSRPTPSVTTFQTNIRKVLRNCSSAHHLNH